MRLRALPLVLCAALALAACATPAEQCLRDAAAPYSAALREQARISEDLARGFRYVTKFERVRRQTTCRIAKGGWYPCWATDMQPVTRRVPVDVVALRARLAEIARDLTALRRTAATEQAQCRVLYPSEA